MLNKIKNNINFLSMLPSTIKNLPNVDSTDDQWILWRDALSKYGKKQANMIFLEAWKNRTPQGSWLTSSKANTEKLRDYLEKKGITLEKGALDYTATFMDGVDDYFTSLFKVGKWVGLSAAGLVVLVIITIIYLIVKNPKETVQLAMGYATGGASLLK
ncbi:MAG: hypothetical protein NVV82_00180 [Sporocytophaga sp.]|nr:hypothetical protein [Sporocytophaga sp.]